MVHASRHARNWGAYAAVGIATLIGFGVLACVLAPRYPEPPARKGAQAPSHAYQAGGDACSPGRLGALAANAKGAAERARCAEAAQEEQRAQDAVSEARYASDIAKQTLAIAEYQGRIFYWQALATMAAFIAAAAAAWAAYRAFRAAESTLDHARTSTRAVLKETREANRISQEALEADSRPWIEVEVVLQKFAFTKDGADVLIEFRMRNLGKSPALRVWPDFHFISPRNIKQTQKTVTQKATSGWSDSILGETLFPNAAWTSRPIGTNISGASMDEISAALGDSGTIPFCLVGSVIYLSPNGAPHETGFVLELMKVENKPDARHLILFRDEDLSAYQVFLRRTVLNPPPIT